MPKNPVFEFDGSDHRVTWDQRLCIHVGECVRAKSPLFEYERKPWGQPDLVDEAELNDVVCRCPSGSLSYTRKDGSNPEQAPAENSVQVSPNGPLFVHGDLDIEGAAEDMPGVDFRAALCRCGQSRNKPFCDNSHVKAGFEDSGAVGEKGSTLETTGGPLSVKPAKNGPLLVQGNLTIRASTGQVRWQGTTAALCRCGHSKNKPFCDGSHRRVGFEAE